MRPGFPLPDTSWEPAREFWAGAAREELRLPQCSGCGRLRWYPQPTCRHCRTTSGMSWTALSGRGRLFSWVVVTHAFLPQFGDKVPFISALVALDEDPQVRLATEVVDCPADVLVFDMEVRVTFRQIHFTGVDGSVMAPLFVPAGHTPA